MITTSLLIVAITLAASSPAAAECDPEYGCVHPITKGESAPFTGQLIAPSRAALLLLAAEGCGPIVDSEVVAAKADCSARIAECQAHAYEEVIVLQEHVNELLTEVEDNAALFGADKWYMQPIVMGIGGILAGSFLTLTAVAVAN